MKEELVQRWIKKAENDLKTARDELNTEDPATDTVCFHAQQTVEKYLKAFLIFHEKEYRKTHNIAELIELCREIDGDFEYLYELKAEELTIYATDVRYPDDFYMPSKEEAHEAVKIAEKVKEFVRKKLNF
ncbi:DNA-binding protein [bacterium]|nr:MAG: DNA-binding protein [bacterium]